jgi:hypothetical protein
MTVAEGPGHFGRTVTPRGKSHLGGRGLIEGKKIIGWQGEPVEFGRRLHWEAQQGAWAVPRPNWWRAMERGKIIAALQQFRKVGGVLIATSVPVSS